jgi:hypothetical protein
MNAVGRASRLLTVGMLVAVAGSSRYDDPPVAPRRG